MNNVDLIYLSTGLTNLITESMSKLTNQALDSGKTE